MIFYIKFAKIIKILNYKGKVNLNKLIVKTVLITVIAFVGALALTFGALSIFCPRVLSDFFGSLGGESAQAYFMEREYQKSGEFHDLITLVIVLDEDKNPKDTSKYCEKLLVDSVSEFNEYLKNAGKDKFGTDKSAREYFYSKYAVSELNTGDIDNAITWAEKCVKLCGYTSSNPYVTFISKGASLGKTALTKIKDNLDNSVKYFFTGQEKQDILADVETIEKIIGEIQ